MKKYLFIAAALMLSIIAVATAGAAANDPTPGWDPAPEGHTVTFCHVAGLAEDPANTVTITADEHAVFGQAGHFEENGTTRAGHEQDYLGPCEEPEVPELDCSDDYDPENNGPNGDCTVDPDPDPAPIRTQTPTITRITRCLRARSLLAGCRPRARTWIRPSPAPSRATAAICRSRCRPCWLS